MDFNITETPMDAYEGLEDKGNMIHGEKLLRIETRFGKNVRMLRKQRRLTQEELAALCHVHQHYISDIERGVRNVSLRVIETLARALDVDERDLL